MLQSHMKKFVLLFSLLFVASQCFAITIINNNSKAVKYTINDPTTCGGIQYNTGEISPDGGGVVWTKSNYYHPSRVCVHAMGMTSTVGAYAFDVRNDSCMIVIRDAGFMRGITIDKVSGC